MVNESKDKILNELFVDQCTYKGGAYYLTYCHFVFEQVLHHNRLTLGNYNGPKKIIEKLSLSDK